jgi:hypothetical protein
MAVVHADWDAELVLPNRIAQQVSGCLIEMQMLGYLVKLSLSHLKRAEGSIIHDNLRFRAGARKFLFINYRTAKTTPILNLQAFYSKPCPASSSRVGLEDHVAVEDS